MNSQQARALVQETFPKAFDKRNFREFVINLLNSVDETKQVRWDATHIKATFKENVAKCERIGTYTSPDGERLDVLVVYLTKDSKLTRARTAIRDFVADHLKQGEGKDAALVAFVSPSEKSWRFSYIKMEYAAVEGHAGKVSIQTWLTPARRSSYIVGEDESCHTAQSRFLSLLQDTLNRPTLAQIEDAFNVEAVTKEFFEQYKELLLDLRDEVGAIIKRDRTVRAAFADKGINTGDFSKKLMGQIVFLYFLQKKGWLGVARGGGWGDGTRTFLRQLFDGNFGKYSNFFNDVLEPLFYDALATDRGSDAWCGALECRIPFLNGGLFEPLGGYDWKNLDIIIPNSLFSNTTVTEYGDKGTGILDVFDRYNFTVNEAEPLEKEVAIDPEMLGKVFESLLEVEERKSKGSYYTPREIVHYMCRESLIKYLETASNSGDTVVPRVDIEAFLHAGDQSGYYEASRAVKSNSSPGPKLPRAIEANAKLLDQCLAEIAVCDPAIGSGAFPVGMMHEIVCARSALTPYFNDPHERSVYHFKRHAIQSCLYGVDIDHGAVEIAKLRLWLSLVVDEEDVTQIRPLPNLDYKIVGGNSLLGVDRNRLENWQAFYRLEDLKPKFFDEANGDEKQNIKGQIDELIHQLTNGKRTFDFEIYFSEVFHRKGGFDIVIGNPPYALVEKTTFTNTYGNRFPLLSGKPDLYRAFVERSLGLAHSKGLVCFIVPNTLLAIPSAQRLREFITRHKSIRLLIDVTIPVFGEAAVNNIIVLIEMQPPNDNYVGVGLIDVARVITPTEKLQRVCQADWRKNGKCEWAIHVSGAVGDVVAKLEVNSIRLGAVTDINLGMQVYHNTLHTKAQIEARYLHSRSKQGQNWLPEYSGRSIGNFSVDMSKQVAFVKYSALEIYQKPEARFFEGPRLILREITSDRLVVAFTHERFAVNKSCYILRVDGATDVELKALLAILSSKCVGFWVKLRGDKSKQSLFPRITMNTLRAIPISADWKGRKQELSVLVDRILAARAKDGRADVGEMERAIDDVVYELYALTREEINIVEDSAGF